MRLIQLVLSAVAVAGSLVGQTYTISTLAGGAPPPTPAPAVSASLAGIASVATDSSGNVYFGLESFGLIWSCVFKVDSGGTLTRLAGTCREGGFVPNGAQANSSPLSGAHGLSVDPAGNVYISEFARVSRVSPDGLLTTFAGVGGLPGILGDGGKATAAGLSPGGTAIDGSGNFFLVDGEHQRIRKVSPDGTITTVAGNGNQGYSGDGGPAIAAALSIIDGVFTSGIAVDGSGNLYIGDTNNNRVRRVSGKDGTITTIAGTGVVGSGSAGDGGLAVNAQLSNPRGVAVDQSGNVYIADTNGSRIRRISPDGFISTVAGNGTGGYSGDGGSATAAQLAGPNSVAVDAVGNLYIADTGNNCVRKVSPNGVITTVAGNGSFNYSGDGSPATSAQVGYPAGAAVDGFGNVYFADFMNQRIRKVSSTGTITTIAGTGATGNSGNGGPAAAAQLNLSIYGTGGLTIDFRGNLYVAENNRIRKITPTGVIFAFAGTGTCGYSGDGGPATAAQICGPRDLAVDSNGNLYLTDFGRVRKITSDGMISTVAGNGTQGDTGDGGSAMAAQITPTELAVDSTGNIYIAESFNCKIRKVNAGTGIITTVVGNGTCGGSGVNSTPATAVSLGSTGGIAVDVPGNLFIQNGNGIDIVTPNGVMNTIAGHLGSGYTGDGGPARQAAVQGAGGISVDFVGNVYFVDSGNSAIRVLNPTVPSCSYLVNPTSLQASGAGGSLTLNIQTNVGCAWTISALPNWITVSGTASGSGPAAVTLVAQGNTSAPRTATISVAGTTITVAQPSGVLTISTTSLVPGATGLAYSQTLSVTGGTTPYSWSLTSGTLPGGLTLSTGGAITGTPTSAGAATFSVRVTDASSLTASQAYTLTVVSAGTPVRTGSLAHIAAGGYWTTAITLVNTSTSPVAVSVVLHGDDGSILSTLPVTTTQQGITRTITGSSISAALNPNTTVLISAGDPAAQTVVGWADVLSSGPVGGFAIFRSTPDTGSPSEGTVPLQTQMPSAIVLPYDNTAGFVMGVALANLSVSSATITATMWDDSGTLLGTQPVTIAGSGHTSFVVPTQLPLTSGKRGVVRFQSSGTGAITGLGLRFSPFGTFTSVPTLVP